MFLGCILASLASSIPALATGTQPTRASTEAGAQTSAQYLGSAACSRCHLAIAGNFAKASMGHSLTEVTPEYLKTLPLPATYTDPNTKHSYSVYTQDGKLYQSEFQTATDGPNTGNDIFRNTHQIRWIIGTGENGLGGLLTRGGYLFQAPLSYYTHAAQWNLSPGYEHGDYGFNRIILPGCISCHSGRPQPIAGFAGKYAAQPFTHASVGCENCHGPGSTHVSAMRQGEEVAGTDSTIVNPARLSPRLSDEICLNCHEIGDARILQPGKTYQDIRPGQPLDRVVAIFNAAPTPDNPPQDDHLEHYYSMTLSKCYRASKLKPAAQQMRCITCHDPHVEPTRAQAPAYFNAKCLTCHTTASCTAPAPARKLAADNCIGCHMPRRDIVTISHSSVTNHRILARPDEPFPAATFQQATPLMPDLIHLDPGGQGADQPTALTRMLAYRAMTNKKPDVASYHSGWLQALVELETTQPENALVQANLGHRELLLHNYAASIDHLQHALQLDPQQPEALVDLSEAQYQSGQIEPAIVSAQRAVALDPYVAPLQKTLISRLVDGKHYPDAEAAIKKYLEEFPEDDFMRRMLAMIEQ